MSAKVVHAQCSTYAVFNGEGNADRFGKSVAGAGDVNGDGYADVIVGAWANENGGADAGAAYVYSGQDLSLIYAFYGAADLDNFGWSVAGVGDLNSDGYADVIVGARSAGGTGMAYVYSGIDGSLMHTFSGMMTDDVFGWSVAGAGDVNGDLIPDIIVGAPSEIAMATAGSAHVYSGADFSQLYQFNGEAIGDAFGSEVAAAGDVNLDGRADVIVGARFNDAGGLDAGRAYVFSGLDGSVIHMFTGASAGNGMGFSVAGGVDLDEDTYPDLIISANDAGNVGAVHTFSGLTGGLIYTLVGEATDDEFGRSVAGVGDLSSDGVPEVVVGAKFNDAGGLNAGRAYIYSGKTGALLHVFTGEADRRNLGTSVASAGDVNLDGVDDVIVGGPRRARGLANVYTCIPPQPIPTISEWGAVIFGTFLLASVVVYIRRRRVRTVPVR